MGVAPPCGTCGTLWHYPGCPTPHPPNGQEQDQEQRQKLFWDFHDWCFFMRPVEQLAGTPSLDRRKSLCGLYKVFDWCFRGTLGGIWRFLFGTDGCGSSLYGRHTATGQTLQLYSDTRGYCCSLPEEPHTAHGGLSSYTSPREQGWEELKIGFTPNCGVKHVYWRTKQNEKTGNLSLSRFTQYGKDKSTRFGNLKSFQFYQKCQELSWILCER